MTTMMRIRHILSLFALAFLVGAPNSSFAQGVLNRRTLGNLNVPQLQRGSITPLTSSLETAQLGQLTREQQIQLAMLNSANMKDVQSRLPDAIKKDSLAVKDYVKRNIFRDTLIFGSELFTNGTLDFAPNLELANAPNYIVGVGDALTLTIFGAQEASYELEVQPNGTLVVPYAGVISVSGLTLKAVESRLKAKLTAAGYTGLRSGNTELSLALTRVRTINVSVLGARKPGTYSLPSIATVMHALYQAGGPAENGSYRKIELVRNGEVLQVLDLYAFIATGDLNKNVVLQEGDVIRIPVYEHRVNMMGEFKRPGLFEVLPEEGLAEVIQLAGSFSEGAYTGQVIIFSTGVTELHVSDVSQAEFAQKRLGSGDVVVALPLRNRYDNRLSITGGVVRPGYYGWEEGLSLQDLITRAQGLDRQALTSKAVILRRPDQAVSSYLELNPSTDDVPVFPNDSIYIGMFTDLATYDSVTIRGEVLMPGRFVYHPGITAEQLVLMAGGISSTGDMQFLEVSNSMLDSRGELTGRSEVVIIPPVFEGSGYPLRKGATVTVRKRPNLQSSSVVYFTGAIQNPGAYALTMRGERLQTVFARVGELDQDALPKFGLIVRESRVQDRQLEGLFRREERRVLVDSAAYVQEEFVPIQRRAKDTIAVDFTNEVQLSRMGLMDGDSIYIPRELNFVLVQGAVKNRGGHAFVPGRRAKYYINQAGGYRRGTNNSDVLVAYANGRSKEVKYVAGIWPVYPPVYSNTTITVVPRPITGNRLSAGEVSAFTSSLASISSVTLGLIYLLRP